MRHVPQATMQDLDMLTYHQACLAPCDEPYDANRWLYVPPFYTEYRYVLGTVGQNPLLCIGLNPSTAKPDKLDRTLQSVERVAAFNGFDSFLMMNLYPQRATMPRDMDQAFSDFLHRENLKAFADLLQKTRTVWAAWGAVMKTRPYLSQCVRGFLDAGSDPGIRWVTAGQKSKDGHPHHPLYLKSQSSFEPFDILAYSQHLEE